MRIFLLMVLACSLGLLGGCAKERDPKPVGPAGSAEGDMPWNRPMPGEGQGAFGGVFDRQ